MIGRGIPSDRAMGRRERSHRRGASDRGAVDLRQNGVEGRARTLTRRQLGRHQRGADPTKKRRSNSFIKPRSKRMFGQDTQPVAYKLDLDGAVRERLAA